MTWGRFGQSLHHTTSFNMPRGTHLMSYLPLSVVSLYSNNHPHPTALSYSCLTFKTRQEAVWLSHFNRGSLGQVSWCSQTASLSNRVPLLHRLHYPRLSIYSDSLSDSSISLHHCRLSVRDSDYAISADVSNVLPATPLEPDKLISGFAADVFEHKLIAV